MTNRKPWQQGGYHVEARACRTRAWADPDTRCRRCHRTIDQCFHKDGTPGRWTAGHVVDGEVGGLLAPECSPCAAESGARRGNQMREPRSEDPYR